MPITINGSSYYSQLRTQITGAKNGNERKKRVEDFKGNSSHVSLVNEINKIPNNKRQQIQNEYINTSKFPILTSIKLAFSRIFLGYNKVYSDNLKLIQTTLCFNEVIQEQNRILNQYFHSQGITITQQTQTELEGTLSAPDVNNAKLKPDATNKAKQTALIKLYKKNEQILEKSNKKLNHALMEIMHLDRLANRNKKYSNIRQQVFYNMYKYLSSDDIKNRVNIIQNNTPVGRMLKPIFTGKKNTDIKLHTLIKDLQLTAFKQSLSSYKNSYQWFANNVKNINKSFNVGLNTSTNFGTAQDVVKYVGLTKIANTLGLQSISLMQNKNNVIQDHASGEIIWSKVALEDSIKSTAFILLNKNLEGDDQTLRSHKDLDRLFVNDALRSDVGLNDTVDQNSQNQVTNLHKIKSQSNRSAEDEILTAFNQWIVKHNPSLGNQQQQNIATSIKTLINQAVIGTFWDLHAHTLDDAGHVIATSGQTQDHNERNPKFDLSFDNDKLYINLTYANRTDHVWYGKHHDYLQSKNPEEHVVIESSQDIQERSLQTVQTQYPKTTNFNLTTELHLSINITDLTNLNFDSLTVDNQPVEKINITKMPITTD